MRKPEKPQERPLAPPRGTQEKRAGEDFVSVRLKSGVGSLRFDAGIVRTGPRPAGAAYPRVELTLKGPGPHRIPKQLYNAYRRCYPDAPLELVEKE